MNTTSHSPAVNELIQLINELAETNLNAPRFAIQHPDKSIREFYKGLLLFIQDNTNFLDELDWILVKRPRLTLEHLASLLPRAAQYALRKKNLKDYATYNQTTWATKIIPELRYDPTFIHALYNKNNSMTRPYLRYRALTALASALNTYPLVLYDWGCSLNLGLAAVVHNNQENIHLMNNELQDFTSNSYVKNLIAQDNIKVSEATGIDEIALDDDEGVEWVKACERFNDYDSSAITIQQYLDLLEQDKSRINQIAGNVLDLDLLLELKHKEPQIPNKRRIIHSSIILYQLSEPDIATAYSNASTVLEHGDLFLELTYKDPSDFFKPKNIVSRVYYKNHSELKGPYEWLIWENAHCQTVYEGEHFNMLNKMLQ